jgi:hypothetical protein
MDVAYGLVITIFFSLIEYNDAQISCVFSKKNTREEVKGVYNVENFPQSQYIRTKNLFGQPKSGAEGAL